MRATGNARALRMGSTGPLILAHRGDWSRATENSLAAFKAAISRPGIDGVEFDVRMARDSTPVVVHDVTLRRVQGVGRSIRDLWVAELRDRGVPSLEEVLDVLPAPFFLDIELKDDVAARAIPIIAESRGSPPRDVAVSSFDLDTIASVTATSPDWRCWLVSRRLDGNVVRSAVAAGCVGIAVRWPALTPVGLRLTGDAGLELATWTVTDPEMLSRMRRMSLVAVCVDPSALT